ncbi:MAG: hypothetical protein HXX16_01015 [Bacteroidales bacterium]|nr:hypothetical protein [Bacteroidales bacterium]
MNQLISRGLKILFFIFIIIVSDQVIGLILRKLYFNQKEGSNRALNYTFKECKSDILVFGASQALHNYDSRIITDSLGLTCFDAGQDGGHSILLQYAQIKVIAERYSPRLIFLEFNPKNIVHYPGDYDRLSILLPYYKEYPELRPLILLRSPYERIKLFSAIYPFNSKIFSIIRFNIDFLSRHKKDFEGYIPIKDKVMNIGMLKTNSEIVPQPVVDMNMLNALENIIHICKKKNVTLCIVSSPLFHTVGEKRINNSFVENQALDIIRRENVKHFDFSYDSLFMGRLDWFADAGHLNEEGATNFTKALIRRIKYDKDLCSLLNVKKK